MNLTATEDFRFVVPVELGAEHIDRQGHLNNAAVARLLNDLRIAYVAAGPGKRWYQFLQKEGVPRVVAVRELHISYEREATTDDRLLGCVRITARQGKAKLVEQRIVDAERDLVVARSWALLLFVENGVVTEFPDFYWEALAVIEGAPIPVEARPTPRPWGPPRAAAP